MEELKRVIIFDGEIEYSKEEIDKDDTLTYIKEAFIGKSRIRPLINKINKERGTIIMNTDKEFVELQIDLIGVSASLYFEFMNR